MPYTSLLTYDALLSLDEVSDETGDSLAAKGEARSRQIERAIEAATSDVVTYLGYSPIVHLRYILAYRRWRSGYDTYTLSVSGFGFRVSEVLTPGVTLATGPAGQYLSAETDPDVGHVEALAGWRRRDQTLATLQASVPGLTTLPALLPGDIRDVALNLTLATLATRDRHMTGLASQTTQTDGASSVAVNKQVTDTEYRAAELSRLAAYREVGV